MKRPSYFGYFRSEWLKIVFVIVLTAIFTTGNFVETLFVSDLVDKVQTSAFANIWLIATILLVVEGGSRFANFLAERLVLNVKSSVIKNLYMDLARALVNSTVESVGKREPAEIAERMGEAKNFVNSVFGIFQEAFSILAGVAAMLYTAYCSWQVAILLVIFLAVFFGIQTHFRKKMSEQNLLAREATDYAKQFLLEVVSGFADVKFQNLIRGLKESFLDAHAQEVKKNIEVEETYLKNSLVTQVIVAIYKYSFLILTAFLMKTGAITFAQFVALFMYKGYVQQTASGILKVFKYLSMISTSTTRMDDMLCHATLDREAWGDTDDCPYGPLTLEGVSLTRGDREILHGIDLTFNSNAFYGIVGPSGSGKSTLIRIANGQYRPDDGKVSVSGIDITELTERAMRKLIRPVSQFPYLFPTLTIRENLAIANPGASDEEIWDALRQCSAETFVQEKGGLDTTVSAKDLSGGERQRLALARTILSGGKIIMLDESTSALDSESQSTIVDAIKKAKKNHTIIMVAHRVSTLKDADQIIFMENGTITDRGTYKELYERNPKFRYMADQG